MTLVLNILLEHVSFTVLNIGKNVSMSVRMILYWLHSNRKWEWSSIPSHLHKGYFRLRFRRDAAVDDCNMFSVLSDRFP